MTGADAIHPGYGFLSENPYIAEICEQLGITFIGPTPEVIEQMGDKVAARRLMKPAGLPVLPGSEAPLLERRARPASWPRVLGYPLILKAVGGGGGRGHARGRAATPSWPTPIAIASAEAGAAFRNPDLYFEQLPDRSAPRRGAGAGRQPRPPHPPGHARLLAAAPPPEGAGRSPAPGLTADLLDEIAEAAVKGCRAISYSNAGTLEFLVDRRRATSTSSR